jgi:hypothetical protein
MKALLRAGLVLATVACLAGSARAQNVELGLVGGATYSTLSGDFVESADWKWGGYLGGYLRYMINDYLGFAVNAAWLGKGANNVVTPADTVDVSLTYFELPLTLNVAFPLGGDWYAGAYAGGALGFQLSCSVSETDCASGTTGGIGKGSEWTIPVGAGVGRRVGEVIVALDARYAFGLSDVFQDVNVRTRTWNLLLRVIFPID